MVQHFYLLYEECIRKFYALIAPSSIDMCVRCVSKFINWAKTWYKFHMLVLRWDMAFLRGKAQR